jgi:hypothetical protein
MDQTVLIVFHALQEEHSLIIVPREKDVILATLIVEIQKLGQNVKILWPRLVQFVD